MISKNMIFKANAYRLPKTTTPETLETNLMQNNGSVLTFGNRILATGYFYNPNGKCYFGAVYGFVGADHTCEGQIELVSVSEDTFEDNGHAIAWAMEH